MAQPWPCPTNHSHLQPKSIRTKSHSPDCAENTITWVFSLVVRSVFCPELLAMTLVKLFLCGKKAQASPALGTEKLKQWNCSVYNFI